MRALMGKTAAGARGDALLRCHFVIVFDAAYCQGWHLNVVDDGEEEEWTGLINNNNNSKTECTMRRIFDAFSARGQRGQGSVRVDAWDSRLGRVGSMRLAVARRFGCP
jgi:hypothetical protein